MQDPVRAGESSQLVGGFLLFRPAFPLCGGDSLSRFGGEVALLARWPGGFVGKIAIRRTGKQRLYLLQALYL